MPVQLFPHAKGEAAVEYERLAAIAADLAQRVRDVEAERAAAVRAAHEASARLTALERRRAAGEDVDDATRRKAEKALLTARGRAEAPWAERLAGAREAARQADHAARRFAAENYVELAAEIAEDARQAAVVVDDALRGVMAARIDREAVAQRGDRLIALAAERSRPGLIPISRIGQAAIECEAVLTAGGERAPVPPDSVLQPNAEVEEPEAVA
jgi:hypothetical protein